MIRGFMVVFYAVFFMENGQLIKCHLFFILLFYHNIALVLPYITMNCHGIHVFRLKLPTMSVLSVPCVGG